MAKTEEQTPAKPQQASSRKATLKAIIIIVAILTVEAGTIIGTMWLSGGPAEASAEGIAADQQAAQNRLVEVELINEKFTNQRSGRLEYFDTQIVAIVKNKNVQKFKDELETMRARVRHDVDIIFRRADPAHFQEPTRATLRRQVLAVLNDRFGEDADGQPLVHDLVLTYRQYRADY
jgi:flagellar basal body-associated protein FliL